MRVLRPVGKDGRRRRRLFGAVVCAGTSAQQLSISDNVSVSVSVTATAIGTRLIKCMSDKSPCGFLVDACQPVFKT